MKIEKLIVDRLVKEKVIAPSEASSLHSRFRSDPFHAICYLAFILPAKADSIGRIWADSIGVAYANPVKTVADAILAEKLTKEFLRENSIVPLVKMSSERVVTVAMAHPDDVMLISQIESVLQMMVSPVFAFPSFIMEQIDATFNPQDAIRRSTALDQEKYATENRLKLLSELKEMVDFVREVIMLAVHERASDVHVEPTEDKIRIRLRIDGELQERFRLDKTILPPLSNRLKLMGGCDISEVRKPQDGRMSLEVDGRAVDLRFSSIPTIHGEKIVLRILGQSAFKDIPELEDIGLSWHTYHIIRKIINSPNGVFFVTGPTGSGKTTTLYTALKRINHDNINIVTIEDPVEFRLEGVNQVQVNPVAGVTFASALRAFLRQDPDVMLIGEIRDMETATIASQAALTGHLVLTTMHTNNALQALGRLIQIGVEPFLVAPSIVGVMGQRLVRKLCPHCREKYLLSELQTQLLFDCPPNTEVYMYNPVGCDYCNGIGYYGRLAIHEVFMFDEDVRGMIAENRSLLEIQKAVELRGFRDMRYDGYKKALRGLTTIAEVDSVISEE
jgi:type IV pilus assembly protein PilB